MRILLVEDDVQQDHTSALALAGASQTHQGRPTATCLLVAPASLLANCAAEIERFAPSLRARILHLSAMSAGDIQGFAAADVAGLDLVITSYGTLLRQPGLAEIDWRLVILDEAQAIKNPNTK